MHDNRIPIASGKGISQGRADGAPGIIPPDSIVWPILLYPAIDGWHIIRQRAVNWIRPSAAGDEDMPGLEIVLHVAKPLVQHRCLRPSVLVRFPPRHCENE